MNLRILLHFWVLYSVSFFLLCTELFFVFFAITKAEPVVWEVNVVLNGETVRFFSRLLGGTLFVFTMGIFYMSYYTFETRGRFRYCDNVTMFYLGYLALFIFVFAEISGCNNFMVEIYSGWGLGKLEDQFVKEWGSIVFMFILIGLSKIMINRRYSRKEFTEILLGGILPFLAICFAMIVFLFGLSVTYTGWSWDVFWMFFLMGAKWIVCFKIAKYIIHLYRKPHWYLRKHEYLFW